MRLSLAIASLLLGSYVAGIPMQDEREEGELSDGSPQGSAGKQSGTPEGSYRSHRSQRSGSSSAPSLGLGLDTQHKGVVGSAALRYHASVSFSFKLTCPSMLTLLFTKLPARACRRRPKCASLGYQTSVSGLRLIR